MTVGDKGTVLIVSSGGFVMTGGTAVLLTQPASQPRQKHSALSLAINTGIYTGPDGKVYAAGTSALYTLQGNEWAFGGGRYQTWLQVNPMVGEQFTVPATPIDVNPYPTP